jgi:hypothetical protein
MNAEIETKETMKIAMSSLFRLIITAIQISGLSLYLPGFAIHSASLALTPDTSSCINELTIEMSANPSTIVLRQSSVVGWSIDPLPECLLISVQLNGRPVPLHGN